jgi:hypothetical protein
MDGAVLGAELDDEIPDRQQRLRHALASVADQERVPEPVARQS